MRTRRCLEHSPAHHLPTCPVPDVGATTSGLTERREPARLGGRKRWASVALLMGKTPQGVGLQVARMTMLMASLSGSEGEGRARRRKG